MKQVRQLGISLFLAISFSTFSIVGFAPIVAAADGWIADSELINIPCVMNVYAYVQDDFYWDPYSHFDVPAIHDGHVYVPWPNQKLGESGPHGDDGTDDTNIWTWTWGKAKNIFGAIVEATARAELWDNDIPGPP